MHLIIECSEYFIDMSMLFIDIMLLKCMTADNLSSLFELKITILNSEKKNTNENYWLFHANHVIESLKLQYSTQFQKEKRSFRY